MDDKNRSKPIEIEDDQAADQPSAGPAYNIDSEGPEAGVAGGAEDGAPAAEATPEESKPRGKGRSRFSRREILDRFQEKNSVIARLTREKSALEKAQAELEGQTRELKDRWLRTAAEFENYRKRTAKEWELLKQQSRTEVILEVLNSLDDFERAFAVVEGQEDSEFIRGIRLIYNNLLQVLQKLGVSEVSAHHEPFDPSLHMAVGQIETTDARSGHVAEVVQKGYSMDGMVIRPARVIVAK